MFKLVCRRSVSCWSGSTKQCGTAKGLAPIYWAPDAAHRGSSLPQILREPVHGTGPGRDNPSQPEKNPCFLGAETPSPGRVGDGRTGTCGNTAVDAWSEHSADCLPEAPKELVYSASRWVCISSRERHLLRAVQRTLSEIWPCLRGACLCIMCVFWVAPVLMYVLRLS